MGNKQAALAPVVDEANVQKFVVPDLTVKDLLSAIPYVQRAHPQLDSYSDEKRVFSQGALLRAQLFLFFALRVSRSAILGPNKP